MTAESISIGIIITGLLAALEADAANPKPDYSIDGQTVSRAQWRLSLTQQIEKLQTLSQNFDPYELRGQVGNW